MFDRIGARAPAILATILLLLTLTTPYLLGASGAYLQIVCALLACAILITGRRPLFISGDPTYKLLLIALLILIVVFALTAERMTSLTPYCWIREGR